MTSEQIALSASHAAWMGAIASACASIVALSIAVWGSRREESRRRSLARDQETAFCFAMVGAMEVIKPIILHVQAAPEHGLNRRKFNGMVEHARTIAEAGLRIPVLDMQLLRDGYQLWGAINYLRDVGGDDQEPVSHAAVAEVVDNALSGLLAADDRFFKRLPPTSKIQGIAGRTLIPGLNLPEE